MKRVFGVVLIGLLFTLASCEKDHCSNGVEDQDEFGIDCGGLDCTPCPSCFDGIKNQGEEGIDCGGSCEPCSLPWTKVNEGGSKLNAIAYSGSFVVAVGDNGLVIKSNDSGLTWSTIPSVTTENLLDVDAVSSGKFYACGTGDVVVSSADGNTLTLGDVGTGNDWKRIHFTHSDTGIIAGFGMRIYRTTDGGKTWDRSFSQSTVRNSFEALSFLTEKEGYAFGGSYFLQTIDGGKNWSTINGFQITSSFKNFTDLYYKTSRDAYCMSEFGMHLFIPGSLSAPWANKQLDVSGGRIDFMRSFGLYAGSNSGKSAGKVLISFDGGTSWNTESVNSSIKYSDGVILSENVMIVVGDNATILRRDK